MKILFNHNLPFSLAHGGFQIQIEQTLAALTRLRVDWEYVRWWDETQSGDILHHFGRPSLSLISFAQKKGLKVVFLDLLTGPGSRPLWQQRIHRYTFRLLRAILPQYRADIMTVGSYRMADACVALTTWEAFLMSYVMGAREDRVTVIPNGVESVFLDAAPRPRGKWLVCTATIDPRKRIVELVDAATKANTPIWVIGKPYSETDSYYRDFLQLVNRHSNIVRYEGAVSNRQQMAEIYREARGFVLLSTKETHSLSALEAAACQCPLLLSNLPWAHSSFGQFATYCPVPASQSQTAGFLKKFYEEAPQLPIPPRPATWNEVAEQLRNLYGRLLRS